MSYRSILLALDAAADVTPGGLIGANPDFLGLNNDQATVVELQLLCQIAEVVAS